VIGSQHREAEIASVIGRQPCARFVDEVTLHHSATKAEQYKGLSTVQKFHHEHTRRGYSDIGYHYLIGPDGVIFLGRPLARVGAHVKNANTGKVGVCMIGYFHPEPSWGFDGDDVTKLQIRSTTAVIRALCHKFHLDPIHNFRPGHGFHRDHGNTACPGSKVTKTIVQRWLYDESAEDDPPEAEVDSAPDVSPWAEAAVEWCKEQCLMTGLPDGLFHGREPLTREQFAVVLHRMRGDS